MSTVAAKLSHEGSDHRASLTVSPFQRVHLTRLAEARGVKLVRLLDSIVEAACRSGEIPDEIPGVSVSKDRRGVTIKLTADHAEPLRLTECETDDLVRDLRKIETTRLPLDELAMLDGGQFTRFRRVGYGLAFAHVVNGGNVELVLAKSEIAQFVRQIEAARA